MSVETITFQKHKADETSSQAHTSRRRGHTHGSQTQSFVWFTLMCGYLG